MTIINLRDFYYWYTQDEYIEVSDDVAEALRASVRYEAAYQRRLSRHKAQYSLDCDDGIEYSACLRELTPDEVLELKERFCRLWNALNSLPETQGRRVDAHFILGMTYREIAKAEGVDMSVTKKKEPITAFLICVLSALRLCVWLFDN
jgi:RNA polymerase sigma-70 factor (ECF subfamily)